MKIVIKKKHLGSLSSLLVLSLAQTPANAEEQSNRITSPSSIANLARSGEEQNKAIILKASQDLTTKLSLNSPRLHLISYKANISKAFDGYYKELNALEEHYQDKVDKALDDYEDSLKLVSMNTSSDSLTSQQAKFNAKCVLAKLKKEHKTDQQALKDKYHIS
ncbi:hypothetical protein [Marinomonas ostreistagni]|uniref:Uncharacterized protein n=1 Tax=Marinomonas ostreistagni TaxID=359209 RepID=A0ABS0ZA29_9GAMM|nr:hypothetical protein [Marinomonas ostreistagni]MBJ7550058.1 hypothetical protein [Marinomonas ostreistagni]